MFEFMMIGFGVKMKKGLDLILSFRENEERIGFGVKMFVEEWYI